eukprot:NODE_14517_length_1103_cov_10.167008.p2 GENE.NODE_14517_length_1103_cov_10.167008~~NODE_14517_length_1103_cov_10.167008.p2  ORF type:complete len:189 (-),score=59.83 NODE_14517_length_1103_cov_10.167008:276-842(-)
MSAAMLEEPSPRSQALQCKERGNRQITKDPDAALRLYKEGLDALVAGIRDETDRPQELLAALHANSAQVHLRQRRWLEAIEACNAAVKHQPSHAKAAWRGATAAIEVDMHNVAVSFVSNGLLANPYCKELLELQARFGALPDIPPDSDNEDEHDIVASTFDRWKPPEGSTVPPRRAMAAPPADKDKAD